MISLDEIRTLTTSITDHIAYINHTSQYGVTREKALLPAWREATVLTIDRLQDELDAIKEKLRREDNE